MAAPDDYRILGVKPTSTLAEVRRRYRLLARQHHPDLNPDDPDATARFRQVVEAFEAILAAKSKAKAKAKAGSRTRKNAAQYRQPQFTGKEDLFEEFFGICQEDSSPSWSAGADFRYDLEIPFPAAIKGMGTVIAVDHQPHCRYCQGSGLSPGTAYRECPECRGRGRRFGGPAAAMSLLPGFRPVAGDRISGMLRMPGTGSPLRGARAPAVRSRLRPLPGTGQGRGAPLPALRRDWLLLP